MPIYEFICRNCGNQFDKLTSYDWKSAGINCPNCSSTDIELTVSRVGGIKSGGKIQVLDSSAACPTCSTGICSTCR